MTFCLKYIIALAAVAFVSACSIKEDRSDCPCILTVTLYETAEEVMISGWNDGAES